MKQFRIPFAVLATLILSSGCMPKKASSTGGSTGSTSTSSVSGTGGGLISTTPTPFATVTGTSCSDPIGDCSGLYPVIQVQNIIKKQPPTNNPTDAASIWVSSSEASIGNGSALITDARLRLRVKVNAKPSRSSCGLTTGSWNAFDYKKLKMKITVKRPSDNAVCYTGVVGPVDVGATSPIIDVPITSCASASPHVITIDNVQSDSYCQWQLSSPYNAQYCANTPSACGCPVAMSDPTNCWSADLQVVTSRTGDFKP